MENVEVKGSCIIIIDDILENLELMKHPILKKILKGGWEAVKGVRLF